MTTNRAALTALRSRHVLVLPAKPVEPVRPITGCDDCDNGCRCENAPGCEHWCCWSVGKGEQANTCPSAAAHRDHMHAYKAYREDLYAYHQSSHRR